jgi:hypothetical protein
MKEYDAIPSWISAFFPTAAMMQPATSDKQTYLKKLIAKLGF